MDYATVMNYVALNISCYKLFWDMLSLLFWAFTSSSGPFSVLKYGFYHMFDFECCFCPIWLRRECLRNKPLCIVNMDFFKHVGFVLEECLAEVRPRMTAWHIPPAENVLMLLETMLLHIIKSLVDLLIIILFNCDILQEFLVKILIFFPKCFFTKIFKTKINLIKIHISIMYAITTSLLTSVTNYKIYENVLLKKIISVLLQKIYISKFICQIWLNHTYKNYSLKKVYFKTYSLNSYFVVFQKISYIYDCLTMIDVIIEILFRKYLENIRITILTNNIIYGNILLRKIISVLLKIYISKYIFQIWSNHTYKSYSLKKIYSRPYYLNIYLVVIQKIFCDCLTMVDTITKILLQKYLANILVTIHKFNCSKKSQEIHSICSKHACLKSWFQHLHMKIIKVKVALINLKLMFNNFDHNVILMHIYSEKYE